MISNYKEFKDFISKLSNKPKLLLHSCCGPCSSYTITLLKKYFDVTIYYSNDNIYPFSEYEKRLAEQMKVAKILDVKVLTDAYNDASYYNAVKGLEELGEHSKRCYKCMEMRLDKTALKAKELNYDYFTTTLSISPHKNSIWINEIGNGLENKYQVKYLYSDFKKEDGYKKSVLLSKEYDLYRQDYCGCIFSLNERGEV